MSKGPVFVTGSTGFIGIQLVKRLASRGLKVHALYRSESKTGPIRMEGVKLFKGDILDTDSLQKAMKGCNRAYHTAAFASVWAREASIVYRLNVEGALNVIRSAGVCGIERVVVTSTAGILGPSASKPVNEFSPAPSSFFIPYESSKFQMEQQLLGRSDKNPEVVIVNPSRVYGPGLLSESNGVARMIERYMKGNWRFIPGNGESIGNYVFVEDVVTGHLLAMEKGKPGERYVLGGENISYNQLFRHIRELSGIRKRMFRIPVWLMLTVAGIMKGAATVTGRPPLIIPSLVRKYNRNWNVSSERAIRELGYMPMDAREGIRRTVEWICSLNKEEN